VTISAGAFTFVSDLLQQHAAIVLSPGKEYLVESRLMPLARQIGLDDVGALVARLQSRPDDTLRRQIVEAMTTNETSFFRDRDPFNAFSQAILPDLCTERTVSTSGRRPVPAGRSRTASRCRSSTIL
jgi:chemotaxis protein methyltransferase CheR